jgi:glycosyltransferase involved in cell wall biosynthesis
LLDIIDYKSSLFRVIDEHNRFHGWNNNAKKIAKLIANKCDTIIYSAKGLEHYVSQLNPERSFLVPNGVDLSLFQKHSQFGKFERHSLLKSISDPLILYSGMIDSRIDFRLLKWAALQLPFISFVLIGPFGENAPPRNLPKNIYFLGSVPHKELPSLIHSARAGIIPFDSKNKMKRIRGIRPLKLFEYMAAGIPVITSRWPEIESLQSPAWIYDSKEEFITLINKAVEHSHSQKTFTNFAKRHDWKNVFNQLLYYTNKV